MVINQYYREMKGKDVIFTCMSDPVNRVFIDDVWKNREKVSNFIKEGTELILDGNRYFRVVGIPDYPENTVCQPYFTLTPIGPTLQEYEKENDVLSRKNFLDKAPDFSFIVEGLWFVYRNVEIVDEIINDSEKDYCSSILDLI